LCVPTCVVELCPLSLCVGALIYGVLCGVFISLFPVTFLWVCTHVLTLRQTLSFVPFCSFISSLSYLNL
jgi:hypothetical protein